MWCSTVGPQVSTHRLSDTSSHGALRKVESNAFFLHFCHCSCLEESITARDGGRYILQLALQSSTGCL